MAFSKPICLRGHIITEVGRYSDSRCKQCLREDILQRSRERRAAIGELKIEAGCYLCGYNQCSAALGYHHRDPNTKSFAVGMRPTVAWSRILEEIAKCDVICHNCHAELHFDKEDHGHDLSRG